MSKSNQGLTYQGLRRPYYPGHNSSYLDNIPEEEIEAFARLEDIDAKPRSRQNTSMSGDLDQMAAAKEEDLKPPTTQGDGRRSSDGVTDYLTAGGGSYSGMSTPTTPGLTRSNSSSDVFGNFDSSDFPPVDRLTMFDILENLALPQRLEKMQNVVHENAEKLRRQRQKLTTRALSSKNVVVEEWKKRVPSNPDEKLEKYRKRMKSTVDRLGKRFKDAKSVSMIEKLSFLTAVLNIFITAYMMGAAPQYVHYWYTAQLM